MTDPRSHPPRAGAANNEQERLRASLLVALRRQCPAWLRPQIEDLAQAALLRAIETLSRSGEGIEGVPASYLQKAAYCALIDEIRRVRARPESPWEDAMADSAVHPSPRPDALHAARREGEAIRECLAAMVPARRRAVTLYLQGHTVPEAAGLLLWTVKKTENLVYRGLADLRACLRGKGIER